MQKKLVIDIIPPEKNKEHFFFQEKEKEKDLEAEKEIFFPEKKERKFLKKGLILFFIFLILIFGFFHFFLVKATVRVWPTIKEANLSETVVVDTKTQILDYARKVIPGKTFEVEKTIIEEFPASGNILKKAEGTIRLYNGYSTQSETWREGTRFVSSEGKLFLSKEKINVPGAQLKNDKIVPSYVDVPVIAAEGGEEYNIGPSKFSVFVFRGTERYTKFYGESSEPMKGGGRALQVTKEDLEKAEKAMMEKVKNDAQEYLKTEITSDYILLKEGIGNEVLEKKSLAEPGTATDKFKFQLRVKFKGIAFKESDIKNFSHSLIKGQLSPQEQIYQDNLKIGYQVNSLDLTEEKINLKTLISFKTFFEIDDLSLKKALAGKSLKEAEINLANKEGIEKSEIKIFPFWLNTIPTNLEKIKIEKNS